MKESENGNCKAYVDQDCSLGVEKSPPLFVYADYEAVTNDSGVQSPILVCRESEGGHEPPQFYGTSYTEDFFNYLNGLTVDEYNDEQRVIVIFHNFKGYDAMFVLQYLYANCREVSAQICIGTKVLSLKSGNLTFKDSLCFLPFSLASFSTFDIKEHKKSVFPHLFNTMENQGYEGPTPDPRFYDPDRMSQDKKKNSWGGMKGKKRLEQT